VSANKIKSKEKVQHQHNTGVRWCALYSPYDRVKKMTLVCPKKPPLSFFHTHQHPKMRAACVLTTLLVVVMLLSDAVVARPYRVRNVKGVLSERCAVACAD